jgi:hypothetical protein
VLGRSIEEQALPISKEMSDLGIEVLRWLFFLECQTWWQMFFILLSLWGKRECFFISKIFIVYSFISIIRKEATWQ